MAILDKLNLIVKNDFSSTPGPRRISEGDFSGELFRELCLEPKLKEAIEKNKILFIDLDGTSGFGTSFLEEGFGGLIRINKYSYEDIIAHIELKSDDEEYIKEDIMAYLEDAK